MLPITVDSPQDIEAGDGTTSVVVIAGALLGAAERLFGSSDPRMGPHHITYIHVVYIDTVYYIIHNSYYSYMIHHG